MTFWAMVSLREALQEVLTVVEGCHRLVLFKNPDKVGRGGEAAFQCDVLDGHGSASKKRLGVIQPHCDQVVVRGETGLLPESP